MIRLSRAAHRYRPAPHSCRTPSPARGFTLIELILVLAVGSMIALLSFQGMKRQTESNQARVVGQQMRTVGLAVNTYIANRYTPITQLANAAGTAADPGPRTCAGSACTITVQTLVNEGLLPATYQNLNSFGSGYTIALAVSGTAPSWSVTGLITTSQPWSTGGVIRYDLLGQAMAAAGADSGMSRASATRIDGYGGVWNAAIPSGGALGLLGFQAGTGTGLYSVYLRRDGTLPMTGDLNLSDGTNHNLINASNITGTGRFTSSQAYSNYVNLAGNLDMTGTATVTGAVNVNGNTSVSGTVYTNGFTDYGNATVNGNVGVGGAVSATGAVSSSNSLRTPGAVIDGPGNLTANGVIYAAIGLETPGAVIDAPGNLTANGTVSASVLRTSGAYLDSPGNLVANGNVSGNLLIPTSVNVIGGACGQNGAMSKQGDGRPIFCRSGQWQAATKFDNFSTTVGAVNAQCVAGGDPNPPNYDRLSYDITCGNRFCQNNGFSFGMVTESPGLSDTQPFYSPSNGMLQVSCSE